MTPFEFVSSVDVPPGVQVLALDVTPYTPLVAADLPALTAPLPPAVWEWLTSPNLDITGKFVTRMGKATFGPLGSTQDGATVQGLAFVDASAAPVLLALVWLEKSVRIIEVGSGLVVQGPVLAVRQ